MSIQKSKEGFNKYILKGKRVYICQDVIKWGKWMEEHNEDRIVKQEYLSNGYYISTVFLGLDHNFTGKGERKVFETMVFDDLKRGSISDVGQEVYVRRYSTWHKALKGHARAKHDWKDVDTLWRVPLTFLINKIRKLFNKTVKN